MKFKIAGSYLTTLLLVVSCTNSNSKRETPKQAVAENTATSKGESQQGNLVGEWEQQYSCYDKKGNYKPEPDKGSHKELIIKNVHDFTIIELASNELIMGGDGAFLVFKKSTKI